MCMKARDRCTEDGSLRQTPGEKKVKKKMHDLHFFWVVGRGVKVILRFFDGYFAGEGRKE